MKVYFVSFYPSSTSYRAPALAIVTPLWKANNRVDHLTNDRLIIPVDMKGSNPHPNVRQHDAITGGIWSPANSTYAIEVPYFYIVPNLISFLTSSVAWSLILSSSWTNFHKELQKNLRSVVNLFLIKLIIIIDRCKFQTKGISLIKFSLWLLKRLQVFLKAFYTTIQSSDHK